MQYTKDTFLMALRQRLAAVNPQRTMVVHGSTRPAVAALENEAVSAAVPEETFVLEWGAAEAATESGAGYPLMRLKCVVRWWSDGAETGTGAERGRVMGAMDEELRRMCEAGPADKTDYTQVSPVALGSRIFWSAPKFLAVELSGVRATQAAELDVFYLPEEV